MLFTFYSVFVEWIIVYKRKKKGLDFVETCFFLFVLFSLVCLYCNLYILIKLMQERVKSFLYIGCLNCN